jgi:hypothetical protein
MIKLSVGLFHQIWYNFYGKISVWIAEIPSASGGRNPLYLLTRSKASGPHCMGAKPPDLQSRLALRAHHEFCPALFKPWIRLCLFSLRVTKHYPAEARSTRPQHSEVISVSHRLCTAFGCLTVFSRIRQACNPWAYCIGYSIPRPTCGSL